jgi:hypothetical protein
LKKKNRTETEAMLERDGYEQFSGTSTKASVTTAAKVGRIVKSIGAILAGLIAVTVLSLGADVLLHAAGIYPPWGEPMSDSQFALATAYRSVFALGGSFVSAQLAPFKPMQHAVALGGIGFLLALLGTIVTWNGGPEYARKWYPITLILISLPGGWLGGKLSTRMRVKNR